MRRATYFNEREFGSTDEEAVQRMIRVHMALETGWTFEVIDNLALLDYEDMLAVWAGRAKAQEMG